MTNFSPLLVLDCDSTTIEQEVIELIAAHTGSRAQVAAITAAAMRGEYDFATSLRERVKTLAGAPVSVFAAVAAQITFSPGFVELATAAHASGGKVCVVSGGFMEVLDLILPPHLVDSYHANRLETHDGKLTGRVQGEIVTAATKAQYLQKWAAEFGTELRHTIAIGDGANDLEMLRVAGSAVAFKAKPVVREHADLIVDDSLAQVIPLFAA